MREAAVHELAPPVEISRRWRGGDGLERRLEAGRIMVRRGFVWREEAGHPVAQLRATRTAEYLPMVAEARGRWARLRTWLTSWWG